MKRKITLSFLVVLVCMASVFAQKNVLYIQGANGTTVPITTSDANVTAALTANGYTVTTMDDDDALTEAAASAETTNIVIISSTVGGAKVTKYAWINKPIIIWELAAYNAFGLSPNGAGFDNTLSLSINVTDITAHKMLTGFTNGDNVIFTGTATPTTFTTMVPYIGTTKPAKVLANLTGDVTKAAWVMYEKDAELNPGSNTVTGFPTNGLSVNTRIVVPFSNEFFLTPNALGLKMMLNSVEYALTGNVVAQTGLKNISSDVNANVWFTNGNLNIELSKNLTNSKIRVYNTEGKLITNTLITGSGIISLPIANLKNGLYMVVGEGFKGKFIKK